MSLLTEMLHKANLDTAKAAVLDTDTGEYIEPQRLVDKENEGERWLSEEQRDCLDLYGFYEKDNCYFIRRVDKSGATTYQRVSNFVMKVRFLIRSSAGGKRVVELRNHKGHTVEIILTSNEMVNPGMFEAMVGSQGNYIWFGGKSDLNKVKQKLFDEEINSVEIETFGWQPEGRVYAFSNGLIDLSGNFLPIDETGIVENAGTHYFLPPFSKIADMVGTTRIDYSNERKFRYYEQAPGEFLTWAVDMEKTYGTNGMLGVAWGLAALFRDTVFYYRAFFPHLFAFGQRGTGKSAFALSLQHLWGDPLPEFNLGSTGTTKGFVRQFAQWNNGLVFLNEYKNTIDEGQLGAMKGIYDGAAGTRAQKSNDNRTSTAPVLSACLVAGQEMPTKEPALFSRCILLTFATEERTEAAKAQFNAHTLRDKKGRSGIVAEVLPATEHIRDQFAEKYILCENWLKDHKQLKDLQGMPSRLISNAAAVLAVYACIEEWQPYNIATKTGTVLPWPFEAVFHGFADVVRKQYFIATASNDVDIFWEIVAYLVSSRMIAKEQDYRVIDPVEQDGEVVGGKLAIQLTRIYQLYTQVCYQRSGSRGLDKQTLQSYLQAHAAYKDNKKVRFETPDGKTTPQHAWIFDLTKLDLSVVGTDEAAPKF